MIISFEGGEGVGKTTQVRHLCAYLDQHGLPRLSFREPGGSELFEKIRNIFLHQQLDPMSELLLILAGRRENICEIIEPALEQNKIIVIDRFIDSTLVYQGIVGGLGLEMVDKIMIATRTYLEPDLTFVLDMDASDALSRITPRDRFEQRDLQYHLRIRDAFVRIATRGRHHLLDAKRGKEDISQEVGRIVNELLMNYPSI
ncbi:MAG: dTMP kinase [Deltaproteobacteria bacterium]|nr:dTMP kinase [Deltaproteobacteria bacterium]